MAAKVNESRVRAAQKNVENVIDCYDNLIIYCADQKGVPSIVLLTALKMLHTFLLEKIAEKVDKDPRFKKAVQELAKLPGERHGDAKSIVDQATNHMITLINALKVGDTSIVFSLADVMQEYMDKETKEALK